MAEKRETYVLNMPSRPGAFKDVLERVNLYNGRIIRISYNKAVDNHTVFIEISATQSDHDMILSGFASMNALASMSKTVGIMTLRIHLPSKRGEILSILKTFSEHGIEISYVDTTDGTDESLELIMGILSDDGDSPDEALAELGTRYEIEVLGQNRSDNTVDNSVFYSQFISDIKNDMDMDDDTALEFIAESNRILQFLQRRGENPYKVFSSIRELTGFIYGFKGDSFKADVRELSPADDISMHLIQPVCGSNIVLMRRKDELIMVDCGFAVYRDELMKVFREIHPDWDGLDKRVYITHADVDHCGLLSHLQGSARIMMNAKSADSLDRQRSGMDDYREEKSFCTGYSRLSRMISMYVPPDMDSVEIVDKGTPAEHDGFVDIGSFDIGAYTFRILEGGGGHMYGECVFICRELGLVFTGDILLDIKDFSEDLRHFNSIAPYLMTTVDIDPPKAKIVRAELKRMLLGLSSDIGKDLTIIGGHGPAFTIRSTIDRI